MKSKKVAVFAAFVLFGLLLDSCKRCGKDNAQTPATDSRLKPTPTSQKPDKRCGKDNAQTPATDSRLKPTPTSQKPDIPKQIAEIKERVRVVNGVITEVNNAAAKRKEVEVRTKRIIAQENMTRLGVRNASTSKYDLLPPNIPNPLKDWFKDWGNYYIEVIEKETNIWVNTVKNWVKIITDLANIAENMTSGTATEGDWFTAYRSANYDMNSINDAWDNVVKNWYHHYDGCLDFQNKGSIDLFPN
jgi:hypothetical protein